MFESLLSRCTDWLWTYPCLLLILGIGIWFSGRSGFFQIRRFPAITKFFLNCFGTEDPDKRGMHPLKAFFAGLGGAVGIGNILAICIAIEIGGPGSIFWMWVTGVLGMILVYGEVFLGLRHRQKNTAGGYDGGPMYYLRHAFKWKFIAPLSAFLLCIYGVEVFIFNEVVAAVSINWHINHWVVVAIVLAAVICVGKGGLERVGKVCALVIPLFVGLYVLGCLWVLAANLTSMPTIFLLIVKSAFAPHAASGGFAGATVLLAMSQGMARGCYSGDIGIGYASIIHAESTMTQPHRQAVLAVFGIFIDIFVVCTATAIMVLSTGAWQSGSSSDGWVTMALGHYFPRADLFMPFMIFLLGYSTLVSYYGVGQKCAQFLLPKSGKIVFFAYSVTSLVTFSVLDAHVALELMALAGGLLLILNLMAIVKLRKEITFTCPSIELTVVTPADQAPA